MRWPKLRFLSFSAFPILLAFALALPLKAYSAPSHFGLRPDGKLDQMALSKAYRESDWDQVTQVLEGYLRHHGDNQVPVEERIFAYKYLGVIYAADSLSRTKAESYFTRLLKVSPDESIVDLFPSRRVKDLFQDARKEIQELSDYTNRRNPAQRKESEDGLKPGLSKAPDAEIQTRVSTPQPERKPVPIAKTERPSQMQESKVAWVWWSLGIAAAAGAGAGAYYLASREPEKTVETMDVFPK